MNGVSSPLKFETLEYPHFTNFVSRFQTLEDGSEIAPPHSVTALSGDAQISLSWASVTEADYYIVYRSSSYGGTYSIIESEVDTNSYINTGLTNGTTYYYYITTKGTNGMESTPSNIVSATPNEALPEAPGTVSPVAAFATVGGTADSPVIDLTWLAPTEGETPDSYSIYRKLNSGDSFELLIDSITELSYEDQDVTFNQTYYYAVSAVTGGGEGPQSSTASAKTATMPPSGLVGTPSDTLVTLTWTAPTGASGFNVKRSTSEGGPFTTIASNYSSSPYADSSVTNGTTYYYEVTALN